MPFFFVSCETFINRCFVIFDDKAVKILEKFYQGDSNYYERQARNVGLKNADNREILLENGGTEEQADELENLGALRHRIHSTNANSLAIEGSDDVRNLEYGKISSYLEEVGLPILVTTEAPLYSTQDTDDIIADYLDKDMDNLTEEDKEKFYEKVIEEWAEWKEKVNNEIENYLAKIDEKYKTHYKPTGGLRNNFYQASAMYKNKAQSLVDFKDIVLKNLNNPKMKNKTYYSFYVGTERIDVPFERMKHFMDRHNLTDKQIESIENNDFIFDEVYANIENLGQYKGVKIKGKINTSVGKAGIGLEVDSNGRAYLTSVFFDNEKNIDYVWLEKNPANMRRNDYLVSIGQGNINIAQIKEFVNSYFEQNKNIIQQSNRGELIPKPVNTPINEQSKFFANFLIL